MNDPTARKLVLGWLFTTTLVSVAPAQVNTGELRLKIFDAAGLAPQASVTILSGATRFRAVFTTNARGFVDCPSLPFDRYVVRVTKPGFSMLVTTINVNSAVPIQRSLRLEIAPVSTQVQVAAITTPVDPNLASSVTRIGTEQIRDRVSSLPGRSVQDLVNTQPGWLYEGNAVLHPRGSEYQTQFVLDGIPLTDNRSPSFGPEIEADDLSSLAIYTAGFPAEYGRKMGGVVELNTHPQTDPGLHAEFVLSGGSYNTASSFADVQYTRDSNTFGASASGSMTSHYLNPVVPQNFTNTATTGDFSARYEADPTTSDRLDFSIRHEFSRFLIPNELVQQQAGQRQYGDNSETIGSGFFQHIVSPNALTSVAGMIRHTSNDLTSNTLSTPIIAFQQNYFSEGYFKTTISLHRRHHEFKAGIESDNTFLHETFQYTLTDPTQFDPGTPTSLAFQANRPDLEQAVFFEDLVHAHAWTVSAGLRYDHYQLLLNQYAFSPRLSVGRYFNSASLMMHFSYDRIFQTPSFENILLSGSPRVQALNSNFLRLPVQPSRGNYYEGGLTKGLSALAKLDLNFYRRDVSNYADDDQLLNTGVSYPIAFNHAIIYGAEARFELLRLGPVSGYVSYSYMVGNAWFPVTGGLFLGDDATSAVAQLSGHFPDSQDQRNTLRTRFRYQPTRRIWFASGLSYGSGLPFDYTGDQASALAQYGQQVVSHLNFARGRVLPNLSVSATANAELYRRNRFDINLQADGDNLSNRLNVIDFGGLFSGNAIGPARSYAIRLRTTF